ncbi:ABC-type nitrate/sulfonate/bicarbonate transport system, ATPase component [Pseudonocardia sp. Ae168_Ps1]|nr:ABC-type nitrate/sulfonate/bicarbonate transport system, ATPase component [Pseudonocardia sp. Ae150A_Ps1]OLL79037.1 ABC-type nitrate/sulfonate/bicarbonate transport system, ATPase component [Pseudonocardia sp. Ae168_Ps1]OLL86825.1 ABC-type nitrate/sulfonate/bicarbonate transport system, ATPase component [Pseudonocardia sp. Ae263_Ps1]OLL93131.1 ABC-type nitrate/sulfonate/bicarbonate transport system, ATPase component [Pseudonocardia sp. Ae356_Ps1]
MPGAPATTAIRLDGVGKTFVDARTGAPQTVLDDFSLTVSSGELVALVGASGTGKTTLLHVVAGLTTPDRGTVEVGHPGSVSCSSSPGCWTGCRSGRTSSWHWRRPGWTRTPPTPCSRPSGSPRTPGCTRACSPAGSGNGSRWPGRSPSSPISCCSTSRSAPSTSSPPASCGCCCRSCG